MTPALREACRDAVHVITDAGEVLRAGQASLFILERIGFKTAAGALGRRPLVWLLEPSYRLVARNRRLFGRFLFRREPDPRS